MLSTERKWLFANVGIMKSYVSPSIKFIEMKCSRMICLSKYYNRYSSDEQLSKGGFLEEGEEETTWNVNVWEE